MIKTKIDKDVVTINVGENIISENINLFEEKIDDIRFSDFKCYIFDFSNVEYICSSGLGILANVLRKSYETSSSVYFCSLTEPLRKLFDVTKFLTMVKEEKTIEDVVMDFE